MGISIASVRRNAANQPAAGKNIGSGLVAHRAGAPRWVSHDCGSVSHVVCAARRPGV